MTLQVLIGAYAVWFHYVFIVSSECARMVALTSSECARMVSATARQRALVWDVPSGDSINHQLGIHRFESNLYHFVCYTVLQAELRIFN